MNSEIINGRKVIYIDVGNMTRKEAIKTLEQVAGKSFGNFDLHLNIAFFVFVIAKITEILAFYFLSH